MILLRLLSWPYLRRHGLRSGLTCAGIVLGVAVFVGMHTANQSVLYGFRKTVDRIAGATQLQVSAGEAGFDEEVLERVQSLADLRVATPVIEAVASTGIEGQGNLLILGVDMMGDRSLREYDLEGAEDDVIDDPLIFLAQPDSLILTRQFAERNGLKINSRLRMQTMEGAREFTVRGLMRSGGLTSAFGGNIAVMDVYSAQSVFGRGRKFDRIDMAVKEGASVEGTREALERMLGPGFQVETPSARGQHFESIAQAFSMSTGLTSVFALLIGLFIIYNSFAIAVTQRRAEIGILRALGATRAQVRWLFLGEGAVAGLLGSGVGVACGILMARGMAGYIGTLLGEVYGLAQRVEELSTDPKLIATAVMIGVATSVVAAWLPARSAARVDPVQALQKGKYQVLSAGENRARRIAALALAAVSVACLAVGWVPPVFYAGYLMIVFAALLMTPTLALWLARALRPLLKRLRPVEGALAADSLIQSPRRTSATVAALMLSLALAVGFSGIGRASYGAILEWVTTALNPDLFLSTSQDFTSRAFRFPDSMTEPLRRIEGIAEVQRVRMVRIPFRGSQIMLLSADIAGLARRPRRAIAGDTQQMYRLAAAGRGVIVSDNLSLLKSLKVGDMIEIPSPSGVLRLPVVGAMIDYSDQSGTILIDRAVFERYWKDSSVNIFRIFLTPGTSPEAAKERILARFQGERRLFVFTNQDLRKFILRVTDQWLGLSFVQLAVAVLVAILGIVNSLTVSVIDRRRELGVLQAVGGLRNQIRHTLWMEAAAIGVIGLILGLALGAVNLYYNLVMVRQDFAGQRLAYEYPVEMSLLLVPVILGAAFLSALGPAESAVRGSLVEALEYE